MKQKIYLVGLPGAGKTTIGMELALDLSLPFVDLDQEIEKETKQNISAIFSDQGEAHFRQLEYAFLRKVTTAMDSFVLATGGGTPCFFDNMDYINRSGISLFIHTPITKIKERLQQDSVRPLMKTNTLENLYEKRKDWYQQAHHTITNQDDLKNLIDSEIKPKG